MAQVTTLAQELSVLKEEIVVVKTAHATMHQDSVNKNVMDAGRHAEAANKITALAERVDEMAGQFTNPFAAPGDKWRKPLIEPKQVEVEKFNGAVSDSRAKFLEWSEHIKDRTLLSNPKVVDAMDLAEKETDVITMERSMELGVQSLESRELHGFLKDRSGGTAAAIIRNNRSRVGLESWRLLCKQFNPQTLQATLQAHQLETHPKPANKMSDLPQCILEWEKSLLRCA